MKRWTAASKTAATSVLAALLAGCAAPGPAEPQFTAIDEAGLPPANIALEIPNLGPCTDNPDRSVRLNLDQPVTVLVHGCFGSSGNFRGLAQVLAFHGQQTVCFTYNDRDSMMLSSAQLNSALDQLAEKMHNRSITVIGHSQGALVARKALIANRPDPITHKDLKLRLVTVSGPFAGIESARQCGNPLTHALTFGLIGAMCKLVTGDKWSEITYNSDFILQPGALGTQVQSYLKVVTDERDSCRRIRDGKCVESDEIFSLPEQSNARIDADPAVKIVEVKAGHVEIVGDKQAAPDKLIAILQQNGIMNPTDPARIAKFNALMTRLYGRKRPDESAAADQGTKQLSPALETVAPKLPQRDRIIENQFNTAVVLRP
jgi:Palmitoyl protein thioesterase